MAAMALSAIWRDGIEAGVIPQDAEGGRTDRRWFVGEMTYAVWLRKDRDGLLEWHTRCGDRELGQLLHDYGWLEVQVQRHGDTVPWPRSGSGDSETFWSEYVAPCLRLVRDRNDLLDILVAGEVTRGDCIAKLPMASPAGRLVKALILAEHLGESAVAERVRSTLREGAGRAATPEARKLLTSAKDWAKQYGKALGSPVTI
jgi:hypothetical protein